MHPAPSVILFTTFSGLGFGLLAFLGLGLPAVTGWIAFGFYLIGFACAAGGLLAATFHLANPKNARKAFSQWRTSWLSREGICALAALGAAALHGLGAVFFASHWTLVGALAAVLSIATVFTTSMIYTQLRTVPRWNQPLTPVMFLSLSLAGGALLAGQIWLALPALIASGGILSAHWLLGDRRFAKAGTTLDTATGLGARKASLRQFAPPHTGDNYLLREMVHVVGRRHSRKLRRIAMLLTVGVPTGLLLISQTHLATFLAVLSHIAGVLCARWLFFAEAEHVVGLYYGQRG